MTKKISAKKFDSLFDEGEDITPYLDVDSKRSIKDFALQETRKVDSDFTISEIKTKKAN